MIGDWSMNYLYSHILGGSWLTRQLDVPLYGEYSYEEDTHTFTFQPSYGVPDGLLRFYDDQIRNNDHEDDGN